MKEITDLKVLLISLVDKGANGKSIILKSTSAEKSSNAEEVNTTHAVIKTDVEKRLVYGIVYSPDQVDAHGDYMTSPEIEKAMHRFMKASNTNAVDTNHNLEVADGCYIVENWIVKSGDPLFPDEVGAWALAIKIDNDEIWDKVKKGEYAGLSMYGFARKSEEKKSKNPDEKSVIKKVVNFFKSLDGEVENELSKSFESRMSRLSIQSVIDACAGACYDAVYESGDLDTARSSIASIFATAKKAIEKLELAKKSHDVEALDEVIEEVTKTFEDLKKNKNEVQEMNEEQIKELLKTEREELTKTFEDKFKSLEESNESLKTENEVLKQKLEDIEKVSKGSKQQDGDGEPVVKSNVFNWSGIVKKEVA